jgi:hypothetical protein
MSDWVTQELENLRWNWGESYVINYAWPDRWIAQRRDDNKTLYAESADDLRDAIFADYSARPVPRSGRVTQA